MAKKRSRLAFASNLRRVLSKADLRKAELSEKEREYLRKLTYTGITHYRGSPTLRKLCDFLGVTIESLWEVHDQKTVENIQQRERDLEWRARWQRLSAAPKQIAADLFKGGEGRDAFEDFEWQLKKEFYSLLKIKPDPFYDNPLYPILLEAVKKELDDGSFFGQTAHIREIVEELNKVNRTLDYFSLAARVKDIVSVRRTYDYNCMANIFPPSLSKVVQFLFPPEPIQTEPETEPTQTIQYTTEEPDLDRILRLKKEVSENAWNCGEEVEEEEEIEFPEREDKWGHGDRYHKKGHKPSY